jgi:hypothetical protein
MGFIPFSPKLSLASGKSAQNAVNNKVTHVRFTDKYINKNMLEVIDHLYLAKVRLQWEMPPLIPPSECVHNGP